MPRTPDWRTAYVWIFVSVGLILLARFVEAVWLDDTTVITRILVPSVLFAAVVVLVRKWRRNQAYLRRTGIGRRK